MRIHISLSDNTIIQSDHIDTNEEEILKIIDKVLSGDAHALQICRNNHIVLIPHNRLRDSIITIIPTDMANK